MKNNLLIVALFICSLINAQTTNSTNEKLNKDKKKYVGVKVKMPDSSQIVYTTPPSLLKKRFVVVKHPDSSQIARTPDNAIKKRNITVLPSPEIKSEN